jgi:hypothetical protein
MIIMLNSRTIVRASIARAASSKSIAPVTISRIAATIATPGRSSRRNGTRPAASAIKAPRKMSAVMGYSSTQARLAAALVRSAVALRSLISSRNSIRVRASDRNDPSIELVTANEFCFSTPRMDMQRCVASITTATPRGAIFSLIVSAIWLVSRSWT